MVVSLGFFSRNVIRLKRNINLGKGQTDPITNKPERISNMLRMSLGQSKMVTRPIPGILHLIVYLGFIIINIELIEILIDGIFSTHRVFSSTGGFYGFLIGSFEVFAVLVLIAVIAFWSRRNIIRIKRFSETKMMGWPKLDADLILYFEIILMSLFLLMNATDLEFQNMNNGNVISGYIYPYFSGYSEETLHLFERSFWWSHIIGIFIFLNYLYYSKHLHIILAFPKTGGFYGFLIGSFEVFAVLVLIAVIAFWSRRNIIRIKRFSETKMMGWPKLDADLILYFEIILMSLFLLMNATDLEFQNMNNGNVISGYIYPYFSGYSEETLHLFERSFWWSHIIGIFIFLNYLYYSKHLHIILAFPNTYFASLSDMGKLNNMKSVTNEVNIMMGKSSESGINDDINFGASDVMDLSWLQLLNAYSCTECGRCTSVCPANITGKKLSPRKIMMDTRDRIEEVGNNIDTNGKYINDNKKLLGDYISEEELWACTSCNACVEECPISINPLSIIMDMRRNLVMEDSLAPSELNNMMSNIENNGAPWPYNQQDRLNWNE